MRILRVCEIYPRYLESFLANHGNLSTQSYEEQLNTLWKDHFGWSDALTHALLPHGLDVINLVANYPALKTWAQETGMPENASKTEILEKFIHSSRPDILFLEDISSLPLSWLPRIKELFPTVRATCAWYGAPSQHVFSQLKHVDYVLSCVPELVEILKVQGHKAFHIDHAFDRRILTKLKTPPKDIVLSFIGQIVLAPPIHKNRAHLLGKLLERGIDVQIFSSAKVPGWKTGLRQMLWPPRYRFLDKAHTPVFGTAMYELLQKSQITLNSHLDVSREHPSNMRMFEATGVGTCMVTDQKPKMIRLFEPDQEVICYKSAEECAEKIQWLINHPKDIQKIGENAQARVLKEHCFENRSLSFTQSFQKMVT